MPNCSIFLAVGLCAVMLTGVSSARCSSKVIGRERSIILSTKKYQYVLHLSSETNKIPCAMRTKRQTEAYRLISLYQLNSRRVYDVYRQKKLMRLTRNGRIILPAEEIPSCIEWFFRKTKGDGARKLTYRIRKWYYGIGKGTIQKWIGSNHQSTRKRPLFQNKAPLRTIQSKTVNSRHQLDLVDLSPISETVRGVTYRYVLSIQDVFSRHLWLRPLSDKTAKSVTQTVKSLYLDWCFPKIVQTDQGGEFKGQFDRFCKEYNIKHITSRAHHPQTQGKAERSHQHLKDKIRYDLQRCKQMSWVKKLPKYQSLYNNGYHVAIGMTPNECFWSRSKETRENAEKSSVRASGYMIRHHLQKHRPSQYEVGEKVLVRNTAFLAKKGGSLRSKNGLRKHACLTGVIVSAQPLKFKYEIEAHIPGQGLQRQWVAVNDITSWTRTLERQRRKCGTGTFLPSTVTQSSHVSRSASGKGTRRRFADSHRVTSRPGHARSRYYIPMVHSAYLEQFEEGITVTYDPHPDGNCQFDAVAQRLRLHGIHRSAQTLRAEVASFLQSSSHGHLLSHFQGFVTGSWRQYVVSMGLDGTYGDHITLHVISRLFNVQFLVFSNIGPEGTRLISWDGETRNPDMSLILLGHFAENVGEHYVCVEADTSFVEERLIEMQPDEDDDNNSTQPNSHTTDDEAQTHPVEDPASSDSAEDEEQHLGSTTPSIFFNQPLTGIELPHLVLNLIVDYACAVDISSFFSLRDVCQYFRQHVDRKNRHTVHLNDFDLCHLLGTPASAEHHQPFHVSVNRLMRVVGKTSSVMLELKNVFQNPRWHTAWLYLAPLGFGWWEVCNVYWRHRPK